MPTACVGFLFLAVVNQAGNFAAKVFPVNRKIGFPPAQHHKASYGGFRY